MAFRDKLADSLINGMKPIEEANEPNEPSSFNEGENQKLIRKHADLQNYHRNKATKAHPDSHSSFYHKRLSDVHGKIADAYSNLSTFHNRYGNGE